MMKQLGVSQHNMANCSLMAVGDMLFVNTSNGVDEGHINLPQPTAPSFACVSKKDGKVLWTDNSPGRNVLHGQWSSPLTACSKARDRCCSRAETAGCIRSTPLATAKGTRSCFGNSTASEGSCVRLGGRATRNHLIATRSCTTAWFTSASAKTRARRRGRPLWCINPINKGGTFRRRRYSTPRTRRRRSPQAAQGLEADKGDIEKENPNSAAVWHYVGKNPMKFEDTMHRTCGTVTIKNNLLVLSDFSGLVSLPRRQDRRTALDARHAGRLVGFGPDCRRQGLRGGRRWRCDDLQTLAEKDVIGEINMESAIYTSPVSANNVLYIANRNTLFAIQPGTKSEPNKGTATSGSDAD